jgi:hypothetical protein
MKSNKVDFDFQFRVRKYIEYIFREESDKMKEDIIFQKLSKPIKDEFYNQMYGKKLSSITFFKQNFSSEAIKSISTIMKKIDVAPEEIVLKVDFFNFFKNIRKLFFQAGDYENPNFYILFKGEVEVMFQNEENSKKIWTHTQKVYFVCYF